MQLKLAIIGIIRDEWKADRASALARLRQLGYSGIELGINSLDQPGHPESLAQDLTDTGMSMVTCHLSREFLRDRVSDLVPWLNTVNCRYATVSWGPTDSPDQLRADAKLYDEAGARLRDAGITLCYHNHDHEFAVRFGNQCALDILLNSAKPDHLAIHFDVAWGAFGGIDPATFIERHASRIPLIHLKDLYNLQIRGCFTMLGTGLVDLKGSLDAAAAAGVAWATVEQDRPRRVDGFDLATGSILNLRELGWTAPTG